jgi:hypothetical protein
MNKNNFYTLFSIGFWVVLLGIAVPMEGQTYGSSVNVNGDFELASIFAMPTSPASPTEYVAETWYRGNTRITKETTYPINGLASVFFNANSTNDAVIYQRSTGLEANTTYKLTTTARIQSAAGASGTQSNQGFMYVAVRGGTYWAQNPVGLGSGLTFNTATNTTKSFEFNTGSYTDIVVQAAVWKANWGIGYFDDIMIQKKLATITTSSSNSAMGSVTATGTVNWGPNTTVTATPTAGYQFVNWTENGSEVSTNAAYTFAATADRVLVANFAPTSATAITENTNASAICSDCDVTVASGAILTIDVNKSLKSLTVATGGKVTISGTNSLTATNGITFESNSSGTATLVDEYATPTITANVKQYLPQGRNWYLGSPVESTTSPATAGNLTATGTATSVSYYNEVTGAWVNSYTGNLVRGVGYVAVSSAGTGTNKITMSGTLNSGDVPVTLTKTGTGGFAGYNLIANPYPSYINPMSAINANANLEKTIWYRTKGTNYEFETVNTTSGVGTNNAATGMVTGHIPPMQAFWVRTNADAQTFTFTNSMRSHGGNVTVGEGTVPTTPLKSKKSINQGIARIVVTGNSGSDEAVLYFDENASNGYDAYDSRKMFESSTATSPEIFTTVDNQKLVINGLNKVSDEMEIALGFIAKQVGDYSISINEMSNFETGTRIILKDSQNPGTEFELSVGTGYNFSSQTATATTDRFTLLFRAPDVSTQIDNTDQTQRSGVCKCLQSNYHHCS